LRKSVDFTTEEEKHLNDLKKKIYSEIIKYSKVEIVSHEQKIEQLLKEEAQRTETSSFYLVNLSTIIEKFLQWNACFPKIQPFYAIKSNPDSNIVRTLYTLGIGFDCASLTELEEALTIGASPHKIIFANPCKGKEHILYAKKHGVLTLTFDNMAELEKIHELYSEAKLVLRILPDDSHSTSPLGTKFGATYEESVKLIKRSRELDVNLVGVSFHVGSGCYAIEAWVDAIRLSRKVFDEADKVGIKMNLLDIGGGWPGADDGKLNIAEVAKVVNSELEHLFKGVEVIAEPGRFFCTACYTLAVSVISRRERFVTNSGELNAKVNDKTVQAPEREVLYYLSDGVYGSFNNIIFDHAHPELIPLDEEEKKKDKQRSCLFGPTCDSIDVVCKDVDLPDLKVGDWLYVLNMGAYTVASASHFNGFLPPNARYFMPM